MVRLDQFPDLSDVPLYISVGHGEYWSEAMRDSVEGFLERGGKAAFLWQHFLLAG